MDDALAGTMAAAARTFIAESLELLEAMEAALLSMSADGAAGAADAEQVGAVFRAAHTIKGSAGLFGHERIVRFTHVVESVLDCVRDGTLALDGDGLALMLSCGDHIRRQIEAVERGVLDSDDTLEAAGAPLQAALQQRLGDAGDAPATPQGTTAGPEPAAAVPVRWRVLLRPGADLLRQGMDPASFLHYLGRLGEVESLQTLTDRLPAFAEFDAETSYLAFDMVLRTAADRAEIESVFDFVAEGSELLLDRLPDATPAPAPDVAAATRTERPALAPPPARAARPAERASVRVDAEKLDRLIDQVGEIVIAVASTSLAARRTRHLELQECTATLAGLVQGMRDTALQLRMVKIGATFGRFQRVVHDVARELGKQIVLQVSGEDTELDKTVVELISDPLTHLVRNAVDHGIESTEMRLAQGKPAHGTLSLNAYHDSGHIVIEVGDDGGGLRHDRILAKAVQRGLVDPHRTLTEAEIGALIFEAGFSTAEQVTELSGRGVGMDVVKRNITALRGSVDIASRAGQGTTVTVRLPLTLAIIDGFQVGVGRSVFVVPLEVVDECVTYSASGEEAYTDLRGHVLPFVCLRAVFGIAGPTPARQNIVVVKHGGERFGIVVDNLLGEVQSVIKPLSKMFAHVRGISGSSILGSGEVALILDIPALLQAMRAQAGHAQGAADPRLIHS